MSSDNLDAATNKTRKRQTPKPAGRQASNKQKTTIHLTTEASQRLTVHAAMMGLDRSALVERLINDHLRRYVVSDRGGSESTSAGETAA